MKAIKRALTAGLGAAVVSGALLAGALPAHASSWHRVHTSSDFVTCHAYILVTYGGWPADRVKCELDGTWHPFQTYGVYIWY
ncbi:hypothetical protein [Nonomuraea guangzhouensis]|uniref:Secreted protein n=1 Tax=Nonomuraea guangzhouensis TaxID=1291555 RepID=A0ABW4GGC6_9ACTN|nr:hypothetical protein [Nonomuraea guangzhouensis]